MFTVLILLLFSSAVMYTIEHTAQPEAFPSIPATLWWAAVTLTTVGYGDVSPITPLGKFFGAIISILGIGLFAMPAGIIAPGMTEGVLRRREKKDGNNQMQLRQPATGQTPRSGEQSSE